MSHPARRCSHYQPALADSQRQDVPVAVPVDGDHVLRRADRHVHRAPVRRDRLAAPHDVHLSEPIGAFNTFVLICSSVTVVLALEAAKMNQTAKAKG